MCEVRCIRNSFTFTILSLNKYKKTRIIPHNKRWLKGCLIHINAYNALSVNPEELSDKGIFIVMHYLRAKTECPM
jgi:hypothetical protein